MDTCSTKIVSVRGPKHRTSRAIGGLTLVLTLLDPWLTGSSGRCPGMFTLFSPPCFSVGRQSAYRNLGRCRSLPSSRQKTTDLCPGRRRSSLNKSRREGSLKASFHYSHRRSFSLTSASFTLYRSCTTSILIFFIDHRRGVLAKHYLWMVFRRAFPYGSLSSCTCFPVCLFHGASVGGFRFATSGRSSAKTKPRPKDCEPKVYI